MTHRITNRATGTVFLAEDGESVLAAARRQGINLSYSCLNGTCASCRGAVLEGNFDYPDLPPVALTDEEQAEGLALLCQARPRSDLTIIARELAALRHIVTREMTLRISALSYPAEDVCVMTLSTPSGQQFDYLAGQYLDVLLDDGKRRAFSIANAPQADERHTSLELHIRRVAGGGFTEQVFTQLKVGDLLRVEVPLGTFYLRERSSRPIICVAGGTGFAPIKGVIEQMLNNGDTRPLTLYWGARHEADLYMRDRVEAWQRQHEHIRFVPVLSDADDDSWKGRTGLVHEAVIADHADLAIFDLYMTGPPALIDAGRHVFAAHGLPDRHLYYDSFEFAHDILAIKSGFS